MKDIFELLNDSKIDFDKYEEIELDDSQKEEIFNRTKTKIDLKKNKKKKYKKFTAVASIFLVCSLVLFCNENILAFAKHSMNSFIGLFNSGGFSKYQNNTSVECESSGIKITLSNFMLDTDTVYYNVDFDMSDFDYSQIVGNDESIEIDKIDIFTGSPDVIALDNYIFDIDGDGRFKNEDEKISITNRLDSIVNNTNLDIDSDDFDLFDILEGGNVKIKLDFQELDFDLNTDGLTNEELNRIPITRKNTDIVKWNSNYSGVIKGNWQFETTINISDLKNNLEIYNIDKKYEFDHSGYNGYFTIDKLYKNEFYIDIKGELVIRGDKTSEEIEKVFLSIGINDLNNLSVESDIDINYKKLLNDGYSYYKYNYKYNVYGVDIDKIKLNPSVDFNSRYRTFESGLKPDVQKYDSINVNQGFFKNIQNTLKNMLKK
ncbi:MAG: DUF4179 domain-containing protein [Intestinibacter sp.]